MGAGYRLCVPPLFDPLPADAALRGALRVIGGRPAGGQLLADRAPPAPHAARRPGNDAALAAGPAVRARARRRAGGDRARLGVRRAGARADRAHHARGSTRLPGEPRRAHRPDRPGGRAAASSPATFDEMLDRLEQSFDAQRRFVANASHELRSPLTVIRSEAEVALANPDADLGELRQVAEVIEATKRTEALLEGLMVLARSQQGTLQARAASISPDRPRRRRAVSREARERSVRWPGPWSGGVEGERRLLERVIANLLENGVRYNRPGRLGRRSDEQRRRPVVRVENGGPRWTRRPLTGSPSRSSASAARRQPRRRSRAIDRASVSEAHGGGGARDRVPQRGRPASRGLVCPPRPGGAMALRTLAALGAHGQLPRRLSRSVPVAQLSLPRRRAELRIAVLAQLLRLARVTLGDGAFEAAVHSRSALLATAATGTGPDRLGGVHGLTTMDGSLERAVAQRDARQAQQLREHRDAELGSSSGQQQLRYRDVRDKRRGDCPWAPKRREF